MEHSSQSGCRNPVTATTTTTAARTGELQPAGDPVQGKRGGLSRRLCHERCWEPRNVSGSHCTARNCLSIYLPAKAGDHGAAEFGRSWESHKGVEKSLDSPEAFVIPTEVSKSMVPCASPPPTPSLIAVARRSWSGNSMSRTLHVRIKETRFKGYPTCIQAGSRKDIAFSCRTSVAACRPSVGPSWSFWCS